MDFFPLFLKLSDINCLVVGGGNIALRKTKQLLKAHANITIISPEVHPALRSVIDEYSIPWHEKRFQDIDLHNIQLVIAATNDKTTNKQIYQAAHTASIWINTVDDLSLCNAIFPSIIDRNPIIVALSSNGYAPSLLNHLKLKLEPILSQKLGLLATHIRSVRSSVKKVIPSSKIRLFFHQLIDNLPSENTLSSEKSFQQYTENEINRFQKQLSPQKTGQVIIIGAGPGDPELLTLKALRHMRLCDVVYHDRLIHEDILNLVRAEAEFIYVGKQAKANTTSQNAINEALVREARAGRYVLRLKGGDPFIFGRGGEEIETLLQANIPFEVIPGISAANGCAAYANIPLTHRDHAHSVTFLTGHLKDEYLNFNWVALSKPKQTLVFYMGLAKLKEVCHRLISQGGMCPQTPAALIEKGTQPEQRVIKSTVSNLHETAQQEGVSPPTLLIIGHVVHTVR